MAGMMCAVVHKKSAKESNKIWKHACNLLFHGLVLIIIILIFVCFYFWLKVPGQEGVAFYGFPVHLQIIVLNKIMISQSQRLMWQGSVRKCYICTYLDGRQRNSKANTYISY